ncbi:hypothetical protein RQP46_000913 [Phenoliferia psychrophenolica]
MRLLVAAVCALAACASPAVASQGDRSPAFERCLDSCQQLCPSTPVRAWTAWPCAAECAYACTTSLTDLALSFPPFDALLALPSTPAANLQRETGLRLVGPGGGLEGLELGRMVQFSGKWPFRRYLGTQEILSVLFSLANLWAHAKGFRELAQLDPATTTEDAALLRALYQTNALVGINTWIWSVVFHTRDTNWTEKADYFSAAASTLYGLWLALARSGGLYKGGRAKRRWRRLTMGAFGAVFVGHCAYLSRGRFDYGYNMAFNVTVGLLQILLWSIWGLSNFLAQPTSSTSSTSISPPSSTTSSHPHSPTPSPPKRRSRHYLAPLRPVWLLFAFTAFELLDFAPIPSQLRLLDAHALWHASTVGVVRMWYGFLVADVRWVDNARGQEQLPGDGREKRRVQ